MIKKALIAVGAVTVAGLVLFGTDLWSYATTFADRARKTVKRQVPLEFEIERARRMVADLLPDIRQNMHTIAEEEVDVERLEKAIAEGEKNVAKQRDEILALRGHLNEGLVSYRFGGRKYSAEEVRQDLARRFERFKTAEATLESRRQMLASREQSLDAARRQLEGMISAKRDLEAKVEHLEAQLNSLKAAQTTTAVHFDDSRLARARKLVGSVQKQLDVMQRVIDAEGNFSGEIPVDEAAPENIVEEIDEYFGTDSDVQVKLRASL